MAIKKGVIARNEAEAPSKRRSPHVIISPKRGDFKKVF